MIEFEVMTDGYLKMTIDTETQNELREVISSGADVDRFIYDLFEPTRCNGSYAYNTADIYDYLSEAPTVTNDEMIQDDGSTTHGDDLWAYEPYQVRDWVEELLNDGEIVFTRAEDLND